MRPMLPWAFARLQALASLYLPAASSRGDDRDTRTARPPKRTVACAATPPAEARDANLQTVDLRAFSTRSAQPRGLMLCSSGTPEDRALLFSKATQHRIRQDETVAAGATAFHLLPLRPGDVTDEMNTRTRICTHCWTPRCTAARDGHRNDQPTEMGPPRSTEAERHRAEARSCLFSSHHHRTGESTTALLRQQTPRKKDRNPSHAGTRK